MFYTTMKRILLPLFALGILAAYGHASDAAAPGSYYDRSGHADAWSGGGRMIPIHTPAGEFKVSLANSDFKLPLQLK